MTVAYHQRAEYFRDYYREYQRRKRRDFEYRQAEKLARIARETKAETSTEGDDDGKSEQT